ncbi:hypothetical protein L226DRAFT_545226 [Lentinus tigrinus ALCF2SS1-7]|uniref:DUF6535 domain-containing protein n=1 Tax=Lentinus tigrinus ALCF2SS1-6 TaxID=1328759 RepID=A0A5C2SEM7_9APHY|nr:hypothetical protein L227DRAFT_499726 [Lentinus tigrinus ALCF2SS1-6]RPD76096.1 hypothetical protein L226DRAFT_545226 [Lentinus tigrinus ALCF2SS1-7]
MYRPHRRRPAAQAGADERETPSIWDSSEAWAACAKALRDHDEDMIQDWKEEIDTLLVFAGLFSAVLTAFNIESYKLLQQQPEDSVTAILTQISSQLNSFTVNQNFVNTTSPTHAANLPPFRPTAFAVRLNTMWFSSLVCSLLSASLGLLVKQWLREYLAGSSNISRESIRIRQYRYEGLRRWYVPEIIMFLPILLQASLVLFFIGLLDLLWTLHPVVATVATAIFAVLMLFVATATFLPAFNPDCPYKSPQSWVICIAAQSTKRSVAALASRYYASLYHPSAAPAQQVAHGAATPDPFASRLDLATQIPSRLSEIVHAWLHRLSLVRTYSSWKEREKLLTETGRTAAALDDATLAGADAMFMDDAFLHAVVRPCLRDIAPRAALRCVDRILLRRAPRVLNDMPYWGLARSLDTDRGDTGTLTLMHLLLDVLHRLNAARSLKSEVPLDEDAEEAEPDQKDDARRRVLMLMHRLVRAIPAPAKLLATSEPVTEAGVQTQTYALFRRMFEVLAGTLDTEVGRSTPEPFVRERSVNLMLKLFPRFQAVGPGCITAFCAYSKQTRAENAPYRFVQACNMVVRASAVLARCSSRSPIVADPVGDGAIAPLPYSLDSEGKKEIFSRADSDITLYAEPAAMDDVQGDNALDSPNEYASIRPAILKVLEDLEGFLSMPVSRSAECRPTTAMLAECAQAVLVLATHDKPAISPGLVVALSDMIGVASFAGERADPEHGQGRYDSCRDSREREDHDVQVGRQAVRWLRRMYELRSVDVELWTR